MKNNWQIKKIKRAMKLFLKWVIISFKKKDNNLRVPTTIIQPELQDKNSKSKILQIQKKLAEELEGKEIMSILKQEEINPANSETTKRIRKFINYEFKFSDDPNFEKIYLQCTEYVQFRVKQKLGITIEWPSDRPRHGKYWVVILTYNNICKEVKVPISDCIMSFTDGFKHPVMQQTGHIAFVEEVYPDNSIKISEANWDNKGSYKERNLSLKEWRDYWKGKFAYFI